MRIEKIINILFNIADKKNKASLMKETERLIKNYITWSLENICINSKNIVITEHIR